MFKGQKQKDFIKTGEANPLSFSRADQERMSKSKKDSGKRLQKTFILYLNSNPNHSQTMSNPLQQNPSTYENVITSRRGPCFFDPPPCFFDPPLFF